MQGKPTVIEQTSKKWKAQQLIAAALCALGVVLGVSGTEAGLLGLPLFMLGLLWFIVARVLAWWHHG